MQRGLGVVCLVQVVCLYLAGLRLRWWLFLLGLLCCSFLIAKNDGPMGEKGRDLEGSPRMVSDIVQTLEKCLNGEYGVRRTLPFNFENDKKKKFLNLLLGAGLIKRVEFKEDSRKKVFHVTDAGHLFLCKWVEWFHTFYVESDPGRWVQKNRIFDVKKDLMFYYIKNPEKFKVLGKAAKSI